MGAQSKMLLGLSQHQYKVWNAFHLFVDVSHENFPVETKNNIRACLAQRSVSDDGNLIGAHNIVQSSLYNLICAFTS